MPPLSLRSFLEIETSVVDGLNSQLHWSWKSPFQIISFCFSSPEKPSMPLLLFLLLFFFNSFLSIMCTPFWLHTLQQKFVEITWKYLVWISSKPLVREVLTIQNKENKVRVSHYPHCPETLGSARHPVHPLRAWTLSEAIACVPCFEDLEQMQMFCWIIFKRKESKPIYEAFFFSC